MQASVGHAHDVLLHLWIYPMILGGPFLPPALLHSLFLYTFAWIHLSFFKPTNYMLFVSLSLHVLCHHYKFLAPFYSLTYSFPKSYMCCVAIVFYILPFSLYIILFLLANPKDTAVISADINSPHFILPVDKFYKLPRTLLFFHISQKVNVANTK